MSPDGMQGRSPCFTQPPPDRRARRAGRRSRRARRARASAGSASRAEPGEGENWCRRYALKRGFGGRVPRRDAGAEPLLHPAFTRPPSAASGAAQPPRPQGASFRRKREPCGTGGRRKPVQTLCVKTGVGGVSPDGGGGRSPCKWDVSPR